MSVTVVGPAAVMDPLLQRRHALGQDRHDEVWEGVHHLAPHEHGRNGIVASQLLALLYEPGRQAGLQAGGSFNLGQPNDFRVPDLGFHRAWQPPQLYYATAALVIEVLSPDDETYATFDFYARHLVPELWVVDPLTRSVRLWALDAGRAAYVEATASSLLPLTGPRLQAELDWP